MQHTIKPIRKNTSPKECRYKVYFYDLDTRKEIAEFSGSEWAGTGQYVGGEPRTASHVSVVENGYVYDVTAAAFPGRRVAAKVWYAEVDAPDWRKLV